MVPHLAKQFAGRHLGCRPSLGTYDFASPSIGGYAALIGSRSQGDRLWISARRYPLLE